MNSNISTKAIFKKENQLHLPECQSTNDVLFRLIKDSESGLEEGFLVRADYQTSGRGQKGNSWNSENGQNLLFSFLLKPNFLAPKHSFWLSAAISVGLAKALETWLEGVKVKWPNDVLVAGQKIAGILIENTISGQVLEQSVVGIGLNVNQLNLMPQATSFQKILNREMDLDLVLQSVLDEISWAYFLLQLGGWEKIKANYYLSLFRMGLPADFVLPDATKLRGLIKGITEEGRLLIVSSKGEQSFGFKEVAFEY